MSQFVNKVVALKEQKYTVKEIAEQLRVDEARIRQALKRADRRERSK